MSKRWAIIITNDDGQEVISNIAQMEGGDPPDIRKGSAKVEEAGPGVKIGMVRGGGVEAADGWGFPGDDVVAAARGKAAAKPKKGGRPKKVDDADKTDEPTE